MSLHAAVVISVHLALIGIGAGLTAIDARTHRLPNRIVLPTLGALIVLLGVEALAIGQTAPAMRGLIGMLLLGGFYAALRAIGRSGIGGGDVKLAALIGLVLAWHGWSALAVGAASAFVLGAAYVLVLLALRRATRTTRVAFGPWMIIGAVLGIAVGGALW